MSQACFLCCDESVAAEHEIPIPSHNVNLNLFLLNQILGMTDLSNSQLKLSKEMKLCHPCIVSILNIQNLLHQLEKLEKKVSYEKYLIEVQLKETYERRDFHRQGQDQNLNELGRSPLLQLRDEIVTALKSETIETMLTKLQKGTIGQVKSGRIRVMKEVSLSKLDATTFAAALALNDELSEHGSADHIRENTQELQEQSANTATDNSLAIVEEHIQIENTEIVNNDEGEDWNTSQRPFEYKLEDIDVHDEPESYGSFQNSIPISISTTLDPLGMELEPSTNTNIKTELESEAALDLEGPGDASFTTKKFICGVCEARFDNYIELADHDKVHLSIPSNSRPGNSSQVKANFYTKSKCRICSKYMNTKSLKKHMNIHKTDKVITYPRKCSRCGVFCANHEEWLDHNTRVHPGKFTCSVCQMSFQKLSVLNKHLISHSCKKNFHCKLCTSSFKRKESYIRHVRNFHTNN